MRSKHLQLVEKLRHVRLHVQPAVLAHPDSQGDDTQSILAVLRPVVAFTKNVHHHLGLACLLGDSSRIKRNLDLVHVLPPEMIGTSTPVRAPAHLLVTVVLHCRLLHPKQCHLY